MFNILSFEHATFVYLIGSYYLKTGVLYSSSLGKTRSIYVERRNQTTGE